MLPNPLKASPEYTRAGVWEMGVEGKSNHLQRVKKK